MTEDEIMKLEAGRELDALVAEHVIGQTDFNHTGFFWEEGMMEDGDGWDGFYCPRCNSSESDKVAKCAKRYSTDIAAAWQVVEMDIAQMTLWRSRFKPCLVSVHLCIGDDHYHAYAPTVPLAICRAALLVAWGCRSTDKTS